MYHKDNQREHLILRQRPREEKEKKIKTYEMYKAKNKPLFSKTQEKKHPKWNI